jgi:hypothetical protein
MVLASVARLTEVLRRPFTRHIDRHDLGRQVNEHWQKGPPSGRGRRACCGRRMCAIWNTRLSSPIPSRRSQLYAHFDLPLATPPLRASSLHGRAAERPRSNNPTARGLWIVGAALRRSYRRYTGHFAIAPETEAPGVARSKPISPRFAGVAAK